MKSPRLICLTTLTLGGFLCQGHAVAAVQSPADKSTSDIISERRMPAALSAVLCERQAVDADFISNGVLDAQIEIATLKPRNSASKVTADVAKRRALDLALANEQLGYAYGICENGNAWVGTFPAPAGVDVSGSELRLPFAAKTICAGNSLKVLFVSEQRGRSLTVPLGGDLSARLPGQKGYVSVSCVPKRFSNSGPREWALVPTGGASFKDPELLSGDPVQMSESLLKWINEKRNGENLLPYSADQVLGMAANGLIRQKAVHHDLSALANVKINLLKKGIEPLGEDRAAGRTLGEIAGLLWRSPAHRDLLLNPSGQMAGIALSATEDGQLMAVVLIAKKLASAPVAKYQK